MCYAGLHEHKTEVHKLTTRHFGQCLDSFVHHLARCGAVLNCVDQLSYSITYMKLMTPNNFNDFAFVCNLRELCLDEETHLRIS